MLGLPDERDWFVWSSQASLFSSSGAINAELGSVSWTLCSLLGVVEVWGSHTQTHDYHCMHSTSSLATSLICLTSAAFASQPQGRPRQEGQLGSGLIAHGSQPWSMSPHKHVSCDSSLEKNSSLSPLLFFPI